jgi:hypothetical protein
VADVGLCQRANHDPAPTNLSTATLIARELSSLLILFSISIVSYLLLPIVELNSCRSLEAVSFFKRDNTRKGLSDVAALLTSRHEAD